VPWPGFDVEENASYVLAEAFAALPVLLTVDSRRLASARKNKP
jgi:hypothetical protein